MQLTLNKIIPDPLQERPNRRSEIWRQNLALQSPGAYQLVAASGRGKSTLLHILYGLRHDYQGQLMLDGCDARRLKKNDWSQLRRNRFSIVFQDLRLFAHLTARENIQVKLRLGSYTANMDWEAMCERLGIHQLLDKPSAQLSYGERQRVAIVRALIQPFDWLFMDEPFSHLDPANIKKASALIQEECALRDAGLVVAVLDDDDPIEFQTTLRL